MRREKAVNREMIKQWRKQQGVTQLQLSEKSGIARSAIAQIESGITLYPTLETISKLSEAMGIETESFWLTESQTERLASEFSQSNRSKKRTKQNPKSNLPATETWSFTKIYQFGRDLPLASKQAEIAINEMMYLKSQLDMYFGNLYQSIVTSDLYLEDSNSSQPEIVQLKEQLKSRIEDAVTIGQELKKFELYIHEISMLMEEKLANH